MPLDELDTKIVDLLRRDPQTSNKMIAVQAGVTETTVASRIRSLTDRRLIRIMVQRDIRALGDNLIAHLDIFVEGRSVADVGRDLAKIPEISSIVVLMGSPQLIAQVHARDGAGLLETMDQRISKVDGIARMESTISLMVLKYRLDVANLTEPE
ncbi:MAG: putative HTH-type transcriptional regulator [Caulobacter sp.]|nr:putative HTH-type transcriptional regulator [Caulobacter sp.]